MLAPSAMAMLTRRRTSSMAAAQRLAAPADGSNRPSMAKAWKPGVSPCSLT